MPKDNFHFPVMVEEVVGFLARKPSGVYVDGTLGGGGHAAALLRKSSRRSTEVGIPTSAQSGSSGQITIVGIDQDEEAIQAAKKGLKKFSSRIIFVRDNFRNLEQILDRLKISKVDGILLDLGVSSHQLDSPNRGFSFKSYQCHPEGAKRLKDLSRDSSASPQNDIILDMRMDRGQKLSAYEVVNNYSEEELERIFFEYGEEKFSRSIAREIVKRRREKKIKTADDLVRVIKSATPPKYRFSRNHHFATKIFQALRIEVNDELGALREFLPQAVDRLKKGGRLVVISFHSLEDRIAKHFFREMRQEEKVNILTKKPMIPTQKEITLNPRAKSAKMRVIEKIC